MFENVHGKTLNVKSHLTKEQAVAVELEETVRRGNELVDGLAVRCGEAAHDETDVGASKAQFDSDLKVVRSGLRMLERTGVFLNAMAAKFKHWQAGRFEGGQVAFPQCVWQYATLARVA